uniref:hypothetical protein n=1 Tax=Paenibacillus marchantiophytorum TaxID=1619310 RepID=UPI001669E312
CSFRCKGRFCTTCSCGGTEEWSRVLSEDVCQVNHRRRSKRHVFGVGVSEACPEFKCWRLTPVSRLGL